MSENIHQVFIANPITTNASTDLMYFGQSPYGVTNDAAMTYANFSAQFVLPGSSPTFEKITIVGNSTANNYAPGTAVEVMLGGTVTLTNLSAQIQQLGGTGGTLVLPDATTLVIGWTFFIHNNTTGTVTVETNGGATLFTMPAGSFVEVIAVTVAVSAGTWLYTWSLPQMVPWGNTTLSNGGIFYSGASSVQILNGTATASLPLLSGATASPTWGAFALSLGGALTTAGALTTIGAFGATFTFSNTTGVTFPTTGTLATTSQLPSTGTPLALSSGGTAADLTASNGGIFYSTASAGAILTGTATAGQLLTSGASTTPAWTTSTYPATNAVNTLLYASSANAMAALATANSSVLVTSSAGAPSLSTTIPKGIVTVGVTDASNAAAGNIGEVISSNVPVASAVSLTTGTPANITSIILTAGDWNIFANVYFTYGGVATIAACWASLTSATLPDQSLFNEVSATNINSLGIQCPYLRVNVSTTTTVYLSAVAYFSTSTATGCGTISARRAR